MRPYEKLREHIIRKVDEPWMVWCKGNDGTTYIYGPFDTMEDARMWKDRMLSGYSAGFSRMINVNS